MKQNLICHKKSIFKISSLCISLCFASLIYLPTANAQSINKKVINIDNEMHIARSSSTHIESFAKRDLSAFLKGFSNNNLNELPFAVASYSDLKRLKIAYGFEVNTIAPQDILAGRSQLKAMVKGTGVWRFVLKIDNQAIGMMSVEKINGQWQTSGFGGAELAKDIDLQVRNFANEDRSNIRFIRIFQAQSDLIEVTNPRNLQTRFAPLKSAHAALSIEHPQTAVLNSNSLRAAPKQNTESNLVDEYELLEPLRAAIKRNQSPLR